MPEHRRPAIPFSDAPRGTCRWCGEPILYESGPRQGTLDRRRRWHPRCVDAYNATDPRELRRVVRRRDRGHCAVCGLDTYALRRRTRGRGPWAKLRERGFVRRRSLWELDHIVPLVDGGGHDESNLQTLCVPCHRAKSARENRERARPRGSDRPPAPEPRAPRRRRGPRTPKDPLEAELDALLAHVEVANARLAAALGSPGAIRDGAGGAAAPPTAGGGAAPPRRRRS